ncbi:hypothetical protein ABAC460_22875 [Asticcacaulis sp. AC460]|uniref:alpha/beta hydrolase fold domain-containing protein n=1 Tax=Asticcacaulis sp. AC460 TaxID=1282360 RepID=UPI0003C3C374|nr:alpha/beta hydrolase [Asticcacaulis sp. AC460]ESQ86675.1 hypothetical protein ABAC460_22875 [Asticcacaulis sp. AC460]
MPNSKSIWFALTTGLLACAVPAVAAPSCPAPDPALRKALAFTPQTVSPEAKTSLDRLTAMFAGAAPWEAAVPQTVADWDKRNAEFSGFVEHFDGPRVAAYAEKPQPDTINGVNVLRISGPSSAKDGRVLIFAHGGGYTLGTARSTLLGAVQMAHATGLPVVSVDYRTAPRGNWQTATDEFVAVYAGLLKAGRKPGQIGMFGGSAGGGLVGGGVFKLRDQGLPLPGALVLQSPWSDITDAGDTYCTLANADPILTYAELKIGADLYAKPEDQKHPYVSPVYGDYRPGYPPMLIQGGTREIFLSNFVRQYQAAASAGQVAVLDLYEGMPHGFQALAPDSPETAASLTRAADFFTRYLDAPESQR